VHQPWIDLIAHRDLVAWLIRKELKVRYKLPILGFLWALLVPLITSGILWLVFTRVLPMPATPYPYFLFLIAGVFPWHFFSQSVSQSTPSLLESGPLIRKAVFPRTAIPFSVVAANFVNFVLALAVVMGIFLLFRQPFSVNLALLPIAVIGTFFFTLGCSLAVSCLQVYYRDIKYITELGLILWFYLTPIFYPLQLVQQAPAPVQSLYLANPFVYLVEVFRLALLPASASGMFSPAGVVGIVLGSSFAVFILGAALFRKKESALSDWVTG